MYDYFKHKKEVTSPFTKYKIKNNLWEPELSRNIRTHMNISKGDILLMERWMIYMDIK